MEVRKNVFIEKRLWNEFKALVARNETTIKNELTKLMEQRVKEENTNDKFYTNT